MRHQVVMHHRDDLFALFAGLTRAVNDPLQRFGLDAPAVVVGVSVVTAAGECVLFVHIAVDTDDDNVLEGLAAITQGGRVTHGCLAVAKFPVYLGELLSGDGSRWHGAVAVKAARIGVVAVVVARDDQWLDALLFHAHQMLCHALMTQSLAVVGKVTGEQYHCRLHLDNAVSDGSHDFVAHRHHFGFAGISMVNGAAGSDEFGTQQMHIADNDNAVAHVTRR